MVAAKQASPLGADHVRHQLVGDDRLPVVLRGGAIVGRTSALHRKRRSQGQSPHQRETDVALPVAEDDVRRREPPPGKGLVKLVDVARPEHRQSALDRLPIGLAKGDTLECHRRVVRPGKGKLVHDRAKVRLANEERLRLTALHLDFFPKGFHWAPLAVELVLVRMLGVGLEPEQIGLVGPQGGHAPGDVPVPPDQNHRRACHAHAAGVEGAASDVELVEQRRVGHRRLWVAHQHGRAGARGSAVHHPGVAELGSRGASGSLIVARKPVLLQKGAGPSEPSVGHVLPLDDRGGVVWGQGCKVGRGSLPAGRRSPRGGPTTGSCAAACRACG